MIKNLVRIYYLSDFTLNMPLPDGYDGQDFIVRLFTEDQSTYYQAASYNGTLTNCVVDTENNMLNIYVDTGHGLQAGNLRSMAAFDYDNNHFADGVEKLATVTDTNIYLVKSNPNATSAMYTASTLPDLTGSTDYVTKSDLNAAGYITASALEGYVTDTELDFALDGYATKAYVADYVENYAPQYDMSAYVTHDELSAAGYASRTSVMLKQDFLVSGSNIKTINGQSILGNGNLNVSVDLTGYATESYVAEYVAAYAPEPDLSDYVTKSELDAAGYLTSIPSEYVTESQLQQAAYVTESELSGMGYVTESQLQQAAYVTESQLQQAAYVTESQLQQAAYASESYVVEKINDIPAVDLSSYVTKTELDNAGYITSSALNGYATEAYVADYVNTYAPTADLSAYVTKTELNNAGYISSIPSEYITESELSSMGYITASYVDNLGFAKSYTLTQAEYDALIQSGTYDPTTIYIISDASPIDLSYYVLNSYLETYYATQAYVADYVAAYAPTPDLSAYVTKTELNNAGYITSSALNGYATEAYVADYVAAYAPTPDLSAYVTKTELNTMSYATTTYVADYVTTYGCGDYAYVGQRKLLTFTAEQANSTVQLTQNNDPDPINIQYSTDYGVTWNEYAIGTTITLAAVGDSVLFKGKNTTISTCYFEGSSFKQKFYKFVMSGKISAKGDVTSLLNEIGGDVYLPAGCFFQMFNGCTALTTAPDLPSTTCSSSNYNYVYSQMFEGCTSLVNAPAILLKNIPSYGCYRMFASCTSLKFFKMYSDTKGSQGCNQILQSINGTIVAILKNGGVSLIRFTDYDNATIVYYYYDSPETVYLGNYVATWQLSNMSYATTTYVADYVSTHAPTPDLSSYVTKTELDNMSYATTTYVADYVAAYAPTPDLSAYVTKTELDAMSYAQIVEISSSDYNNLSYAEKHNGDLYVLTDSYYEYDLSAYATKSYVVDYVNAYAPTPDLSSYVTKTELSNAAYIDASYVESYYYSKTYVDTYYVTKSYVDSYYTSKSELSAAGYLTYANFEYDSTSNTLTIII